MTGSNAHEGEEGAALPEAAAVDAERALLGRAGWWGWWGTCAQPGHGAVPDVCYPKEMRKDAVQSPGCKDAPLVLFLTEKK